MIRPDKGQLEVVKSARLVLEKRPDARFVIVGRGTGILKRSINVERDRSDGLADKIIMAGYRWDTPDVYAACDMIVIASMRTEASPIVLREDFASGRPVIATKVGDIPEIVRHRERSTRWARQHQAWPRRSWNSFPIRNWRRIAQRKASVTRPKIFRSTK